jgi:hypothetical protein
MDARDKQEILESLESGRDALLAALDGLTEDVATRAPRPGKWSVLECVEHLFLAEEFLLEQIAVAQPSEVPVGSRAREARILQRGTDRTSRLEAPETARPTGRFPTLAAALRSFVEVHDRTVRHVRELEEDPRMLTANHPLIGRVNCYEMFLIIAIHPHRHAAQIREAREAISATS